MECQVPWFASKYIQLPQKRERKSQVPLTILWLSGVRASELLQVLRSFFSCFNLFSKYLFVIHFNYKMDIDFIDTFFPFRSKIDDSSLYLITVKFCSSRNISMKTFQGFKQSENSKGNNIYLKNLYCMIQLIVIYTTILKKICKE